MGKKQCKHQIRRANVAKAAAVSFNSPQKHVTPARVSIVHLLEIQIFQLRAAPTDHPMCPLHC